MASEDEDAAFDAAWGNDDDWAVGNAEDEQACEHVVSDDQLEDPLDHQEPGSPAASSPELESDEVDNMADRLLDEYEADEYEKELQRAEQYVPWSSDLGTGPAGEDPQQASPSEPSPPSRKRAASVEGDAFQGMDESEASGQPEDVPRSSSNPAAELTHPGATAAPPAIKRRRVLHAGSVSAPTSTSAKVAASSSAAPAADGCPHPGYYGGMCVLCQAPEPDDTEVVRVQPEQPAGKQAGKQAPPTAAPPPSLMQLKHLHHKATLKISATEASRIRGGEFKRLTSAKRLVLILDLDHTLLNSVRLSDVSPEHTSMLEGIVEHNKGNPTPLLYCLRDKNLWTKLRPGIHAFLRSLSPLYELHIYTMGDRSYAAEVRRLLDPNNQLFKSAISQCDSTSRHNKDLDVAMAEDKLVLILDDTEQVWPNHRANLIKVERYHFFPASLRQWGMHQPSYLEQHRDEDELQGTLPTCAAVLKEIHAMFFADGVSVPLEQRDVRQYLTRRRQQVLQGCVIVFSSCWPVDTSNPASQPLWKLAKSLGAEVENRYYAETVTHVVTAAADTEKAHTARRDGKHVVAPAWLTACLFRWQKVGESDFPPQSRRKTGDAAPASGSRDQAGQDPADKELKLALASAAGGGEGAAS